MSGNTTVDRAEMTKAAGQIEQKAQQISQLQNTLQSQIDGLLAGWSGNAASAFRTAHGQVNDKITTIQGRLGNIYEKLTKSQLDYSTTEDEQQQASNAILSMLAE